MTSFDSLKKSRSLRSTSVSSDNSKKAHSKTKSSRNKESKSSESPSSTDSSSSEDCDTDKMDCDDLASMLDVQLKQTENVDETILESFDSVAPTEDRVEKENDIVIPDTPVQVSNM